MREKKTCDFCAIFHSIEVQKSFFFLQLLYGYAALFIGVF